MTVYISHLRKA